MKYKIIRDDNEYIIDYYDLDAEGYTIIGNIKQMKYITVYNETMVGGFALTELDNQIEKLSKIILDFILNSSEDDDGDCMLLLDDVDRLRTLMELKYKKFMKNEQHKLYVDKLYYLENALNERLNIINMMNTFGIEGRSR